jgi:hypothetical protein
MARKKNEELGLRPFDFLSMLEGNKLDYSKMPAIRPQPFGAGEAELYMEGLKKQVRQMEGSLKSDQQLAMYCWHGNEKLQVRSVSMPSNNVVSLHCTDAEGNTIQVTGHMNSITFSFCIHTATAPVERKLIGFKMSSGSA